MSRFDECLPLLLKHEGGYVDRPKDPGGATNLGITIGTLSHWLKRPATKAEVKALTPEKVAPIYKANYWDACRCDDLPAGVDYMVFDLAVNSGPSKARRYLQSAVGAIEDGILGPKTMERVGRVHPDNIIRSMSKRRENFYRSLDTFKTFGKGWLRRLEEVTKSAEQMVK
jgi:lysozyme family protein